MSKHIKNEISTLKNSILRYAVRIPENNKHKFNKEVESIFKDVDNTVDYDSLEQIKVMAKTRLMSLRRLYGELENLKEEEAKKKVEDDLLRLKKINRQRIRKDENDEIAVKNIEEYSDEKYYDEIAQIVKELETIQIRNVNDQQSSNMALAFNKEKVIEFQKDYDRLQMKLFEFVKARQEANQNKGPKESKAALKERMIEIFKQNKLDEKEIEKIDFEGFFNAAEIKPESESENTKEQFEKRLKEERDELLDLPDNPTEEQKKEFKEVMIERLEKMKSDENKEKDIESDKIFENLKHSDTLDKVMKNKDIKFEVTDKFIDPNLPDQTKKRILEYEKWKAENQIIRQEVDGEITTDKYGNFQFHFYESEEEQSDSIDTTGKETYVFRDGQLVKGKAKKRKVTTYSNWHNSNIDPDDMRKHCELLDRQHFRGPMWDGIKPRSILEEVPVYNKIDPEHEAVIPEADEEGEKKWGKKEVEEIVR